LNFGNVHEGRYAIAAKCQKLATEVFEKWIIETNSDGALVRTIAGDEFYTNEQLDYEYEDIEKSVFRINHGIYDLPMVGAESLMLCLDLIFRARFP
jgi:hypothetical protein